MWSQRLVRQVVSLSCLLLPAVKAEAPPVTQEDIVAVDEELPSLGPVTGLRDVQFSPDGKWAIISSEPGSDAAVPTLAMWNIKALKLGMYLRGQRASRAMACSADNRWIASGGDDGSVLVWYAQSRQQFTTLKGHTKAVEAVAFNSGNNELATGDVDGRICLWDVFGKRLIRALETPGRKGVRLLAYRPLSNVLGYVTDDPVVYLWDTNKERAAGEIRGIQGRMVGMEFSANGKQLLSWQDDGSASIWDVEAQKAWRKMDTGCGEGVRAAFTRDGLYVATTGPKETLMLWNVASGSLARKGIPSLGEIRFLRYTPDGQTLAIGRSDRITLMPAPPAEVNVELKNRILVWGAPPKNKLKGDWYASIYKSTETPYAWHLAWAAAPGFLVPPKDDPKGKPQKAFIRVIIKGDATIPKEDKPKRPRNPKKPEVTFETKPGSIEATCEITTEEIGFKVVGAKDAKLRFHLDVSTGAGEGQPAPVSRVFIGAAADHPNTMPFNLHPEPEPPPEEVLELIRKVTQP